MILKEIALDLPYIANDENISKIMMELKCERNVATRIDYEENWKTKRRSLSLQTRCISSMFERIMGKIETRNCKKILIECTPVEVVASFNVLSNVYITRIFFNYSKFIILSDLEKKKEVLEIIMKCAHDLAVKELLNFTLFENTYNEIVKLGYKNEWKWVKNLKSPNKQYFAELIVSHEVNEVTLIVVVNDNNGRLVKKETLLIELPNEYSYSKHLGKLIWLNNNQVKLLNVRGDMSWIVSF